MTGPAFNPCIGWKTDPWFQLFQQRGLNSLLLAAWVPYIQIASVWLKHKVSSLTARGQWFAEAGTYTKIDFILAGVPAHWPAAILQGSRQFHGCSQVSSQTTAAPALFFLSLFPAFFFFNRLHIRHALQDSPSILFCGSGLMPWRSEKAPSRLHGSNHQLESEHCGQM